MKPEGRHLREFDELVAAHLGRRIRRRRQFLDLSQEALGERAGINRTLISPYERGRGQPLTSSLVRLASALDVSVDQLLGGIEWEPIEVRSEDPILPEVDDAPAET